jgi:hypothetical protein
MASTERDYPAGHPSSADYVPGSPEAIAWVEQNVHRGGEPDFPHGHPARGDNPHRVDPSSPLATARDYSRPQTIPENEYEGVTGENHAEAVRSHHEREQERAKKSQAARDALARIGA